MSGRTTTAAEDSTERLLLFRPTLDDLADLHALSSDARVWTHYPSLRHTSLDTTRALLDGWIAGWETDGLGQWMVRDAADGRYLGYGGCTVRQGVVWNLGYRFTPESQGRGFATEMSAHAVVRARHMRPDLPVIAYLVEHNAASAAVAQKTGLTLVHRGPDTGNPDTGAVRVVFADRDLTDEQLAATLN